MSSQKAEETTRISIVVNLCLALIKGTAGFAGNSHALIADAAESLTDVLSSIFVLFGIKYAALPPDENHPYGHGKAEPLIAFVIGGFLILVALGIGYQAVVNIGRPQELPETYTLWILVGVICVKEILFRFVSKRSKELESSALFADAWHHRADAITSIIAFVGISIAIYMGKGFEAADDWAALFASILIVFNAIIIFKPAMRELMDEHLYEEKIAQIRILAQEVDGVIDTEKCFMRKVGTRFHVDLHLVVDGDISVRAGHDIAHALKRHIQTTMPEVLDVLIHVEPAAILDAPPTQTHL